MKAVCVLDFLRKIFRFVCPPVFTITIKNGIATLSQGKATNKLVSEFFLIAQKQGILSGALYGVRSSKGITLEFSASISDSDRQRFRNVWNLYRL
jgi:hypothetical protein